MAVLLTACGSSKKSAVQIDSSVKPSVVRVTGKVGNVSAGGSGFIIDAKRGLAVTNAHVVAGLQAIKAKLDDNGNETSASVVGTDPCDDLAVIQLSSPPTGLKALPLGDSQTVKSGQSITVFGFPASIQTNGSESGQSASVVANTGTVSAANIQASPGGDLPRLDQAIQHQAPTSPGDSGGPIVDQNGKVIAITTLGSTQGQNSNYSIAINKAKSILPQLESGKSINDVGWDIVPLSQAVDSLPDYFQNAGNGLDRAAGEAAEKAIKDNNVEGMYVNGVSTGSPAANKHFASGDLILSIEHQNVKTFQDVCDILQSKRPGDQIAVHGTWLDSAPSKDKVLQQWDETITLK